VSPFLKIDIDKVGVKFSSGKIVSSAEAAGFFKGLRVSTGFSSVEKRPQARDGLRDTNYLYMGK
jgi:hypothetical protein